MAYLDWFEGHKKKHIALVQKLEHKGYTKEMIIEYFRYENLKKNETNFCKLFVENKKCHDIEGLNCYLCGCPNFRFDDFSTIQKSYCAINSPSGTKKGLHHDCSKCDLPHIEKFVSKQYNRCWETIMKGCNENSNNIDK